MLGSSADGKLGQVVVGSTTDRLLHSSPVPVAISPRGYRGSRAGGADTDHRARTRARRNRCTWWNGSRRSPSELDVADAGGHASRSAAAPCTHPRSACTPRIRILEQPGRRTCARSPGATEDRRRGRRRRRAAGGHRQRLGSGARRRRLGGRRPAGARHVAARRNRTGCSSAPAAQRSCGTARCRCWCYRASTSRCRGRRRSADPRSSPTRRRPATRPRRRPLRAS